MAISDYDILHSHVLVRSQGHWTKEIFGLKQSHFMSILKFEGIDMSVVVGDFQHLYQEVFPVIMHIYGLHFPTYREWFRVIPKNHEAIRSVVTTINDCFVGVIHILWLRYLCPHCLLVMLRKGFFGYNLSLLYSITIIQKVCWGWIHGRQHFMAHVSLVFEGKLLQCSWNSSTSGRWRRSAWPQSACTIGV